MKHEEMQGPQATEEATEEAYNALLKRSRDVLEASVDLSPAEWVRVREGIDAQVNRGPQLRWAWAAAGVAALSALLLSLAPGPLSSERADDEARAVHEVAGTMKETPFSAGESASIEVGQALTTGSRSRIIEAFGRHRLTLEPESQLHVLAWSPLDMSVHLSQGALGAEIAKAHEGERIHIETKSADVQVLGTQFRVSVDDSGATDVKVSEGVVQLTPRGQGVGEATQVEAGSSRRVEIRVPEVVAPDEVKVKKAKRRRAPAKAKKDTYRLIEIDVPPQKAPNVR